jgi:glycosyltransferase involved in cell wall biosynthesis
MAEARQWLHHWLFPISQPLPAVDIAHASMGGICSMVSIVCQIEHGAGFLLSEHGIYLREAYLAERGAQHGLFGKIMKLAFARRMTELAYVRADAIAPCCDYNHRWEVRLGVPPAKIHTAYYGLDPTVFVPTEREREDDPPVVVWAGRIDPLKDVETLLHAAAIVRRTRPDARFLLFGSAQPGAEDYAARCLELHHTLGLEGFVSFEGFATNVVEAFGRGDIVVLSSVSEGFPYSTLEAMVCGKPVVATAVGGIAEQVTRDCGRIVPPRDPEALAQGLLEVMADPAVCLAMARAARDRGSTLFGIERFRETHLGIYARVMASRTLDDEGQTTVRRGRRRVESDRRAAVGAAGGARGGRR